MPKDREDRERRFNPFANEGDMYKVVLYAGGIAGAIILLVFVVRAVT
jgi:hypothetical protein